MNFNWNKYLAKDEVIKREFSISPRFQAASLLLCIVAAISILFFNIFMAIFVFLMGLLYWYYLKKAKHYGFTNKRIILVDSFIGETVTSIDYHQITDIEITQSAFDQAAKWGTLTINTAGTHVPEVNISFIENPQGIKQNLDEIRDTAKTS
jgi:uncharacterized membrane protein YdbT with pleckstrin-like domain